MKTIIVTLFFIFLFDCTYSQNTFQKTIGDKSHNEYGYDVLELPSGSFIISGAKEPAGIVIDNPYVIKLSANGSILKLEDSILGSKDLVYTNIIQFNSKILLIGFQFSKVSGYADSLVITELDTNLNLINRIKKYFADSLSTGNYYVKNFKDSLLIITGYFSKVNQNLNFKPFALSLDTGYVLNTASFSFGSGIPSLELSNNIYCSQDSFLYSYFTVNHISSYRVRFRLDFTSDSVYLQNAYKFNQPVYIESIRKNNYALVYLTKSLTRFYLLDETLDTLRSIPIGQQNVRTYPAAFESLSANENYLFAAIMEHLNPSNPWWGMQNSNYYVVKLDTAGNKIWERRIGENGYYYLLYNVLATKDGGCLLTGISYDYLSNTYQKDIFIVKLDSNGTTTWTQNIKLPQTEIRLYPNPAHNSITLESPDAAQSVAEYRIYDLQGKMLMHKKINSPQAVLDISALATGVYLIEGTTTRGRAFRAKFVKE